MKIKNKGKVYPSPSSASFCSSSLATTSSLSVNEEKVRDFLSVLSLLPAAILALASFLSTEDREVLAYMITRSLKTTTTVTTTTTYNKGPASLIQESKRKSPKKPPNDNACVNVNHKAPVFDCDCFDCYTSYWFRWDSSPNRELIHQVIEAFEDHLTNGERSMKTARSKRRDRMSKKLVFDAVGQPEMPVRETTVDKHESSGIISPDDDVSPANKPDKAADRVAEEVNGEGLKVDEKFVAAEESTAVEVALSNHKGLARKVLPDVLGLLNSRLWSLWGPTL